MDVIIPLVPCYIYYLLLVSYFRIVIYLGLIYLYNSIIGYHKFIWILSPRYTEVIHCIKIIRISCLVASTLFLMLRLIRAVSRR